MCDGYHCIINVLYTQIGAVDIIIGIKWYVTSKARTNLYKKNNSRTSEIMKGKKGFGENNAFNYIYCLGIKLRWKV